MEADALVKSLMALVQFWFGCYRCGTSLLYHGGDDQGVRSPKVGRVGATSLPKRCPTVQQVPLTLTKLGERVYGAAEALIAGRPTVWVGTSDLEAQTTTISWQTTDAPALSQSPVQVQPLHFPRLLGLFPAPNPIGATDQAPAPQAEGEDFPDASTH
jgi:hypothetical protein